MRADDERTAASARAELSALVADDVAPWAIDLPPVDDPRQAAVLILFGELDRVPSTHSAHDGAVSVDLDVLLLARADTLRAHPGQVAFPGGRLDPGDASLVAAALREAREETGLDPSGVDVLGVLPAVPLAFSRHLVTPVLGWWRDPSPVRVVDEAESAAVFRVPVADLLAPANRGVTVIRRDGREWRGPAFTVATAGGQHVVWGFTATLLDALFDRLGWTEPWDHDHEVALPSVG
ncbi:NUDIX domain-containing protein [Curtobacterium sp. PhB130]|uniref:NUDIX hydrolase n=1 Tax=unclassified Curtobacterium TaxID=257496 RepID=UPI000F4B2B2B|nr:MULTISPECIES: CoA pyrophosphatase [unclassified Curtobacterium]ROS75780.1 NUDIX domain-containing protein [Curtobacterium sp. PhB130]TCK64485.1 NUDIX domain-containing protein [Curtobacterium sp. PhB136]